MIAVLLIAGLSAIASVIAAAAVMLGWGLLSVVLDVRESRRLRANERAVREALERGGKR